MIKFLTVNGRIPVVRKEEYHSIITSIIPEFPVNAVRQLTEKGRLPITICNQNIQYLEKHMQMQWIIIRNQKGVV